MLIKKSPKKNAKKIFSNKKNHIIFVFAAFTSQLKNYKNKKKFTLFKKGHFKNVQF